MQYPQSLDPAAGAPAALVVFGDTCALPWLRLLRPGFRHCFLLRRFPGGWLLYDPRSDRTELALWPSCEISFLIKSLEDRGYIALAVALPPVARRAAPFAAFTCVEAVKRVLGIRRRRILTPWQLYRYLAASRRGESAGGFHLASGAPRSGKYNHKSIIGKYT
jgi:hypothetical protein